MGTSTGRTDLMACATNWDAPSICFIVCHISHIYPLSMTPLCVQIFVDIHFSHPSHLAFHFLEILFEKEAGAEEAGVVHQILCIYSYQTHTYKISKLQAYAYTSYPSHHASFEGIAVGRRL